MNYEDILKDLIDGDDKYFVLTAENRAALRNIPTQIPNNFLDVGIAEMNLVGISAGLALRGRVPIAHALSAFLTMRSYEFIRTDVAYPNLPVKLVGSFAGILSTANGATHQAIEDIALMNFIPNMNIFAPADEDDMLLGIRKIIESPSPYYIRYNDRKSIYQHNDDFKIGEAEVIGDGKDIIIITYSSLFNEAYQSYLILSNSNYSVKLLNLRTVKPLDRESIINSISDSKLVVLIEDTLHYGGIYPIITDIMINNKINSEILSINFGSNFFKPSTLDKILEYEKLSPKHLTEKIKNKFENSGEKNAKHLYV